MDGSDPRLVGGTDQIPVRGASSSPDGRSIVYAGSRTGEAGAGIWDLYVIAIDAPPGDIGTPVAVTKAVDELDPAWSPNGAMIAFQGSWFDPRDQLRTSIGIDELEGASSHSLVEKEGCCLQDPGWAPDSGSLLFVDSNKVASLIQQIEPDGTGRQTVIDGADGPAWGTRSVSDIIRRPKPIVTPSTTPPSTVPTPTPLNQTNALTCESGRLVWLSGTRQGNGRWLVDRWTIDAHTSVGNGDRHLLLADQTTSEQPGPVHQPNQVCGTPVLIDPSTGASI